MQAGDPGFWSSYVKGVGSGEWYVTVKAGVFDGECWSYGYEDLLTRRAAGPLATVQDDRHDVDDHPVCRKHDEVGVLVHGTPQSLRVISMRIPLTSKNPLRDNIPITNQNVTARSAM